MSDEAQIRALLDNYWSEWRLAGDPPDPHRAAFIQLLAGDSLQRETADLEKRLALKEARRLPPNAKFSHATTSVTISGDSATVTECVVDDTQSVDMNNGKVLNGAVATYRLEKNVIRTSNGWALESSSITDESEGVQPCP